MAVSAVHSLFEMDVHQMNALLELLGVFEIDLLPIGVEHVSLAVSLVDSSEHPAVTVEIAELRVFKLLVEVGRADALQEIVVEPVAARCCALRILLPREEARVVVDLALLLWIHQMAVGFAVPPN